MLAGSRYFTGGTVVIDHGLGLFSLFAHLSSIGVQVGDAVKPGTIVGNVGATGRVTGPHLHWAVRANGARVDPLSLLSVPGYTDRRTTRTREPACHDRNPGSRSLPPVGRAARRALPAVVRAAQRSLPAERAGAAASGLAEQLGRALAARLEHLQPTAILSPALGGIVIGQEVGRAMQIRAHLRRAAGRQADAAPRVHARASPTASSSSRT